MDSPCVISAARKSACGTDRIAFRRLTEVPPDEILLHMSDPRVSEHLPLATFPWDQEAAARLVAAKQAAWQRDGLGHWAIRCDGAYVGWGGFQKEGDEWDFGLVLRPGAFGLGAAITRKALDVARADPRIPFVTFLLAPSRQGLRALQRLGAQSLGPVEHGGARFLKFRLETASRDAQRSNPCKTGRETAGPSSSA